MKKFLAFSFGLTVLGLSGCTLDALSELGISTGIVEGVQSLLSVLGLIGV